MSSGGFSSIASYGGHLIAAATALCCYEHLITFNEEVKYVWRRRFSAGSILFVLNRYALLGASLSSLVSVTPWLYLVIETYDPEVTFANRKQRCQFALRFADVCLILVATAYAGFAALRMYALYRMKKTVFILVFCVGIVMPCAQLSLMSVEDVASTAMSIGEVEFLARAFLTWGATSCQHRSKSFVAGRLELPFYPYFVDLLELLITALRIHALVFEVILVCLTWSKTLSRRNLRRPAFRTPFTTVLIRDGTLYFIIIALFNCINAGGSIALLVAQGAPGSFVGLIFMGPLVDTITSICMSRFILNLLAVAEGDFDTYDKSKRWDTLARFVQAEKLGAPLRDTFNDDLGDDDDNDESASRSLADGVELDDLNIRI